MKKTILSVVLMGLVLSLCPLCFAAPVQISTNDPNSDNNFEIFVKSPHSNANVKSSLESSENPQTGGIHNVTAGPVLDNNLNRFCVSYDNNVEISVPDEGLTFYLIYYKRIKNTDGSWSEWNKEFTGATWYFTPEDARNGYLEFYNYLQDGDGIIPPSKGQFMIEMYDPNNGYLLDTFVVNRYRYWYPLLESPMYDNK